MAGLIFSIGATYGVFLAAPSAAVCYFGGFIFTRDVDVVASLRTVAIPIAAACWASAAGKSLLGIPMAAGAFVFVAITSAVSLAMCIGARMYLCHQQTLVLSISF